MQRVRQHCADLRMNRLLRVVMFPVRYADDFVVLVYGTQQQAEAERGVSEFLCVRRLGELAVG
jgi:hypothetical protein